MVRFILGCVVLLVILATSLTGFHKPLLQGLISPNFGLAVAVFLFHLAVLGWMWVNRLRVSVALDTVRELDNGFVIKERQV